MNNQRLAAWLSRALLAASLWPTGALAASVQVTVQGVHNDHGAILVALCGKAEFLRPHCAWHGRAPAAVGTVVITIPDVPPGTYAAQAFHDENNNGRLDRTILGLPEEAMGFSNNAPMHLGPPSFAAASFTVGAEMVRLAFALRYF